MIFKDMPNFMENLQRVLAKFTDTSGPILLAV